ncbi:hypothetical protein APD06_17995 [Acinetobacter baumannii]|uniref:Uncharacterized protein n=2 Tax=Acinetobacter baumannii TaxID=470 RepID=A0AB73FB47_ACIBA|nr:hypothetical protein APD06_17995 [Acinetobacter baumannii]
MDLDLKIFEFLSPFLSIFIEPILIIDFDKTLIRLLTLTRKLDLKTVFRLRIIMIKHLELQRVPQFKNGEQIGEKTGLNLIVDHLHFSFFADEANHFEFYPNSQSCNVRYRALCFSISLKDAQDIQEKIKELMLT